MIILICALIRSGSRMYARAIVETEYPQFIGINQQIVEHASELVSMEDPRCACTHLSDMILLCLYINLVWVNYFCYWSDLWIYIYRSHPMLRNFNREYSRNRVAEEVKRCIIENPVFHGKLEFPTFRASLQRLVNMLGFTNGPNGMVISLLPNRNGNDGKNGRNN